MNNKQNNDKEATKKLHSISKLMNNDENSDHKLKDVYDEDENSNLIHKTLEDEDNLDEQFECCSSDDFTDDSNNYKNKNSSHSSQKKLIEVYSDNDLGSVNNTNSNRNSPDHSEHAQKRKLYDFYSENEINLDDDQEERDEANSEHANEYLSRMHKESEEFSEKNHSEIIDAETKSDSNVENKSSYLGEALSLNGERANGTHKKKKTPIKIENNISDGKNLEREFSVKSSKSDENLNVSTNKQMSKNFLPIVSPTTSSKDQKQRPRNEIITAQLENSSNFTKITSPSSSVSPIATTHSAPQSSPSSLSSSLGKISPNNSNSESKNAKKSKTSTSHQSSSNGSFDNKLIANPNNNNNKSPKPSNTSLSSSASPFDNKFLVNSVPNIFGSQSSTPTLNPSDLTNFAPTLGMPPPFFDPEFLRLASTNPLFRFADFNSPANPYFSSLTNMFRASQQSQNIPLPNLNPFLDAASSPLNSLSSQSFGSNANCNPSQKSNRLNHGNGSFVTDKKSDQSSFDSKQQNGFSDAIKVTNANGLLDKNQIQKTNKSNIVNPSIVKKNETSNVLNGHMQISNHIAHSSPNSSNSNNNSTISSSSPSSKLKFSKFSKLNSAEIQTIKTLINSYKESAAFLSRSAEELEELIGENL